MPMNELRKNCTGAVTVFVTLLLIPAVLVSGTAVDLARIHTARSVVQDANQLALNSVLTQYDALLQDIYGVFGVMKDDPVLAGMLDEYVEAAVFGEDWQDKGSGSFQLIYADSGNLTAEVNPEAAQNLGNTDALRRQIEEYMKYRGPIVIAQELLGKLQDNTIRNDLKIIGEKLQIDNGVGELLELYEQLYAAIQTADKCVQSVGFSAFGRVSTTLNNIKTRFEYLRDCYERWENETDPNRRDDIRIEYQCILEHIEALKIGNGATYRKWKNGHYENEGTPEQEWKSGSWGTPVAITGGLDKAIADTKAVADDFNSRFDDVASIAQTIDSKQSEIEPHVDALESILNSGGCNEDLKNAMMNKTGSDNKSQTERYRSVLQWEIAPLADNYKSSGYEYILSVNEMLDDVKYRDATDTYPDSLTRAQLAGLSGDADFTLRDDVSVSDSRADYFAGFSNVNYKMPEGFKKFADCSPEHSQFRVALEAMMSSGKGEPIAIGNEDGSGSDKDKAGKQRDIIDTLIQLAEEAYNGMTNSPEGAEYIDDSFTANPEHLSIWDTINNIGETFDDGLLDVFEDPLEYLGRTGDMLLLLAYDAAMFSNYTTAKPESIGKSAAEKVGLYEKTASGVTISPAVNYFYQSEWEYLYNGEQDAGKNLNAVTKLLFAVRFVCNYITAFSISSVTEIVTSIQETFTWGSMRGIVLSEFARVALVASETIVDVASLRTGYKVPFIKSGAEWICDPEDVTDAVYNILDNGGENAALESAEGLSYSAYLLFFILAKTPIEGDIDTWSDTLGARTGQLIEWNIINYESGANADENQMAIAAADPNAFQLANAYTGFSMTTKIDLRMLFLSMAFAQDGINGVVPPKTLEVSATDYRGY
ncbi:MAG: DUF5702 domain-containing protein [Oscillospiraceae bacterium]|jgi:hypothetical protein|nr:DUF5702 domain-containing protein [Oscillospiraceae bacterium]